MAESTQHPDGGVAVKRSEDGSDWGRDAYFAKGCLSPHRPFVPTHIAFPVAQAARLIDVDAEWVRDRLELAIFQADMPPSVVPIVLAALRKGAPE